MTDRCFMCDYHTSECTCEADYAQAYQIMNHQWSKLEIDNINRFEIPEENAKKWIHEE